MNCKICGSEILTTAFRKNNRAFVYCNNCRFFFQRDSNLTVLRRGYSEDYFNQETRPEGQFINWQTKAKHIQIINLLSTLTTSRSLLDIGAGYGYFLKLARDHGFTVQGVEPNARSVQYAQDRYHITLQQGFFDETYTSSSKFDIITAFHVIEHVENPLQFISTMRRYLHHDGLILIETPNVESFNSRRLGTAWPYLIPDEHLLYFSPTSLKRLFDTCGMRIIHREKCGPFIYNKGGYLSQAVRQETAGWRLRYITKIYNQLSRWYFGDYILLIVKNK